MVNYSIENMIFGITFSVVATSNEILLKSSAPQRLKLEDADSEKSRKVSSKIVANVDLLFIFTDLEDENISMQIAESAENALTVAILPSSAFSKKIF